MTLSSTAGFRISLFLMFTLLFAAAWGSDRRPTPAARALAMATGPAAGWSVAARPLVRSAPTSPIRQRRFRPAIARTPVAVSPAPARSTFLPDAAIQTGSTLAARHPSSRLVRTDREALEVWVRDGLSALRYAWEQTRPRTQMSNVPVELR